jgi:hypothetical protein
VAVLNFATPAHLLPAGGKHGECADGFRRQTVDVTSDAMLLMVSLRAFNGNLATVIDVKPLQLS